MSMFCPKCGHQVTDSDKFCSQCGSADPAANAEWLKKVQERMSDPEYRKRVEEEAKRMLEIQDDIDNNRVDSEFDPEFEKWMEEQSILMYAAEEEINRLRGADDTKKKLRREWNEIEVNQLMKEYESDWSTEKISVAHERTENDVIQKLLTKLLLPELSRRLEPWSDEEEKAFASEYTSGISLDEIAKIHNRSLLAVAIRAAKLGVGVKEVMNRIKNGQKK